MLRLIATAVVAALLTGPLPVSGEELFATKGEVNAIGAGKRFQVRFGAGASGSVTILLRDSGDPHVYLRVFDPKGRPVMAGKPLILYEQKTIKLDATLDGRYTIEVGVFGGKDGIPIGTGTYSLSARRD